MSMRIRSTIIFSSERFCQIKLLGRVQHSVLPDRERIMTSATIRYDAFGNSQRLLAAVGSTFSFGKKTL